MGPRRIARVHFGLITLGVIWFSSAPCSRGEVHLVRPDGSGDFPTILAAVNASESGDEILLGDGTFTGDENLNILVEYKALTIRSESGNASLCIIDCSTGTEEFRRAFYLRYTGTQEPVIEGVTIANGDADIGAGIGVWLSSPRIRNCVFLGNTGEGSGALHLQESLAVVEGCLFVKNVATTFAGGAIWCGANSAITVSGCTFWENAATGLGPGGGIASRIDSSVTIENCIIAESTAGEGVHCDETSTVTISCSNVFGNSGGDWVGCLQDQLGLNGNISADPLFCDPTVGDFTIRQNSPCAPKSSVCGLMGALPVGCEALTIEPSSWGRIKAGYRGSE